MNNKMIKGSLAGATGVALLMGGFGTYALWSDSATMAPAQVTSGTLDVSAGTASWTDQNGAWTPGTHLMVPGDTVTRTQNFTFSGSGKNLEGAIVFTPGTETERSNPAGGGSAADSLTIDVDVAGITLTEVTPNCWEFTVSDVGQTATTTVDFELTADNQDLQGVTASVTGSAFSITQNATC